MHPEEGITSRSTCDGKKSIASERKLLAWLVFEFLSERKELAWLVFEFLVD